MLVAAALLLAQVSEAKPKVLAPTYTVGWNKIGPAGGQCYMPPDWASLGPGDKKLQYNQVRNEMMSQWRGEKDDGVHFEDKAIENLETTLLAVADRVETVSTQNWEQCKKAFEGGGTGPWEAWFDGLRATLTVGECPTPPLDYQLFDYLSLNSGWQIPVGVCKGDHIKITASPQDSFQIVDKGPWLHADGDSANPAPQGFPCTEEACHPGEVIAKFTSKTGTEIIFPVGFETEWSVPDHGTVSVMINDNSMTDNKYRVESGIESHLQITYGPADKK
jgi:hypothetical protein